MKKNALLTMIVLFSMCLILFACRKDIEYFVKDRTEAPSTKLELAKIWRLRNLKHGVAHMSPFWDHSWIINSSAGDLIVVPTTEKHVANKELSIRRFFIFSIRGNIVTDGQIIELLGENFDVESHTDELLKNLNNTTIAKFSGAILSYDINYSFKSSVSYKNGKQVADRVEIISSPAKDYSLTRKSAIANTTSCSPVQPDRIGFPATMCPDGFVTFSTTYTKDEDGCYISIVHKFISITCPSDGNAGSASNGSGSGSGGNGYNPPYGGGNTGGNENQDIIDRITDPCLKKALKAAKDANFTNTVVSILSKLNSDVKIKVTVKDQISVESNGVEVDGKTTDYVFSTSPTNQFSCTILLNSTSLKGGSKEYAVSTIIHEAIHAFLQYDAGNVINHNTNHDTMATKYVTPFATLLSSMFPALTDKDATALAWGGLQKTELWKESFKNDAFKVGNTNETMTYNELQGLINAHHFNIADNGSDICE